MNGDGKFQPGDTILYTVTITNSGAVDLTGVTFSDIIDSNTTLGPTVNVGPLALNDTFSAVANTLLEVGVTHGSSPAAQVAGGVLGNDTEFLGDTFTLSKLQTTSFSGGTATAASAQSGSVTMNANGTFTYLPAVGFTGTDTFNYTITDKGLDGIAGNGDDMTSVGTVSITVGTQKVWYVDSSYAGANGASDGRSTRPFTSFTATNLNGAGGAGDVDGAGDIIFLRNGNSQTTAYGGIALEANQTLQGEGTALVVGGFNLVSAGTLPKLANAGGVVVALSTDNKLRGFNAGNGSTSISGTSFNTLDAQNVTINNPSGAGLSLTTGSFVSGSGFNSITSSGGTNSISLTGVNGPADQTSINLGSGSISNASGAEFYVSGGNVALQYSGTINNSVGRSVDISTHSVGNITLLGTFSDFGTGVSVTNNPSGTITFSGTSKGFSTGANTAVTYTGNGADLQFTGGTLNILTLAGTGINASTNTGSLSVTGTNNAINSFSGTALYVLSSTIGASGLTFQSISSGSSGTAGIVLASTGTAGGLTVTGTGTAGSGGTIANKTGSDILSGTDSGGQTQVGSQGTGLFLKNTKGVSLAWMQLNDFSNFAIYGNEVADFSMDHTVISGVNGSNAGTDRGEASIRFDNLTGTASSITNSAISGGYINNIRIIQTSGTLGRLTVSDSTIGNTGSSGKDLVYIETFGTTTSGYTFTNNTLSGSLGDSIYIVGNGASAVDGVIRGNTFNNTTSTSGGSDAYVSMIGQFGSTAAVTFDISNNKMNGASQFAPTNSGIRVINAGSSLIGTVQGNTIGPGTSGKLPYGILVRSLGSGTSIVLIQNNTITGYGSVGIELDNYGSSTLNASLFGNVTSSPQNSASDGVQLQNGFNTGDTGVVNLVIGSSVSGETAKKNDFSASTSSGTDVVLQNNYATSVVNLSKNGSSAATVAGVVQDDNLNPATTSVLGLGTINLVNTLPTLPPVVAPLMFAPGSGANGSLPGPNDQGASSNGGVTPSNEETPLPNSGAHSSNGESSPTNGEPTPVIVDDGILSQAELDSLVGAAKARWIATGLSLAQIATLNNVTFSVADLPGWYLGSAAPGHITLDANAAGNSWFIDATPNDDSEFVDATPSSRNGSEGGGGAAATGKIATANGGAAGRIDALTTVMHELGHQLGLDDSYVSSDSGNLMYGYIHQSERRLPTAHQADGATPHLAAGGLDFATVPVTIGSLPIGKSVQIAFTAQINANPSSSTISNQGTVGATQIPGGVQTDGDTLTVGQQPTLTQVVLPEVNLAIGTTTSVAEDSAGNLVYTFTRESPLTNPLTVNFSVSGGAVFTGNTGSETDYTQSGAATFGSNAGTVTFAANSNTATVTITPKADTAVENNETVILTLASGSGYNVATSGSTSGTGTILNDDSLVATLTGGNLTVADLDFVGQANDLSVKIIGTDLVITDANQPFSTASTGGTLSNGDHTITFPLASVTGSLTINGGGASDQLTLDLSSGNFINGGGLVFNGGESAGDDDRLVVTGYNVTTATLTHTGPEAGNISLAGLGSVSFTEIEPLTLSGTAADLVINLPAGPNTATVLSDDGGGADPDGNTANTSAIDDATFEYTQFLNPTNSLTINRGSATDALAVNALPEFTSSLTLGDAANPFGTLTFSGAVSLGADKSLSAYSSGTISLSSANSDIATSGTGAVTLTTDRDISLVANSSISVVDGNLTLGANTAGTGTGAFIGISLTGASLTSSGSGDISLLGFGGDLAGSGSHYGVSLQSAATVASTGTGKITLTGSGGIGTSLNAGVVVTTGSIVSSVQGKILLDGHGGDGTAGGNIGVLVGTLAQVQGSGSAPVEILGTDGASSSQGRGVDIEDGGAVSVVNGDLHVSGISSAVHTAGGAQGVILIGRTSALGNSILSSTGTGDILVEGIGGTGGTGVTGNGGIIVTGGMVVSSGSGDVVFTGTPGSGGAANLAAGIVFNNTPGTGLSTATGTGNVTLIGDTIALSGTLTAGTNTWTIRQKTNGVAINLGTNDVDGPPATLGLTDAELDLITASTVIIGDANSGLVTISGIISPLNYKTLDIEHATTFRRNGRVHSRHHLGDRLREDDRQRRARH